MQQQQSDQCLNAEAWAQVRQSLPPEAFKRTPFRFLLMMLHVGIVFFAFHLTTIFPGCLMVLIAVTLSAHSLMCLSFLAHDLSHGSILAPSLLREIAESLAWGLGLISRTVWRKVHNQTHHAHFGTLDDPDRQFVETERGVFSWLYCFLFLPNRDAVIGNPLVIAHQFFYNFKNLLAVFIPGIKRVAFVPASPSYSPKDKLNVMVDLISIAALQLGLYWAAGSHFYLYLTLAACTTIMASAFSMLYIFTNHFLCPVSEYPLVLDGCTSVVVPRWCDVLHSYFSFHTEHHLFPTLNPKYYPVVSKSLAERFPNHYQRIPICKAWQLLWKRPMFEIDPVRPKKP